MEAAHAFCPHCGFDLAADSPIALGDLWMDPRMRIATWQGRPLPIHADAQLVLYALAKAYPMAVKFGTLAERIGYEGRAPNSIIAVYISRLRRAGLPIRTILKFGYAWGQDAEAAVPAPSLSVRGSP